MMEVELYPRGKVYAGHPEYDALHLRHVRTTENRIKGVTLDGWVVEVVSTRTVLDFARVTDRTVADPDAELNRHEPEANALGLKGTDAAVLANKTITEARHDRSQEIVVPYLQEHGLTSATALADALGFKRSWVRQHLTRREGTVYQRIRTGRADRWGLAGVTYDELGAHLPASVRPMVDVLREHGPMTIIQLTGWVSASQVRVRDALWQYTDVFVQVGKVRNTGSKHARLWGLVGEHDG